MSEVLLSAFNPSTMSPQLLEAIFVEREPLVQELLTSIRGSLSPTSKAHSLILGPRGMGKTHLVSLLYHRIREGREGGEGLDEHLRIAWLREEERGIATFFHLLRRILVVLSETYKDPELRTSLAALSGNSPQDTQVLAERLLVEWLGGKTLLLLVENFEDMLHRMGEQGQQAFRAFLQNRSCCLVLATAPTLTAELSKQTKPFYNFFNLHALEEFSVETARGLMRLIAQQRGDKEFADFLETPVATERLRAIEDLAGGHPRIWILFAGFLTKEILDDLVPAFYKLVDELTPYYQSKMENLPGQEALIIETLCEKPGAMPVKELAEACFLASNAVSAHLNDLTKRGFVRNEILGRESRYELREPLLRIWIQVKGEHREPIRVLVEFIKRWFTINEIKYRYDALQEDELISREYYEKAVKEIKENFKNLNILKDEIERFHWHRQHRNAWEKCMELIKMKNINADSDDWFWAGVTQTEIEDYENALKSFDKSLEISPNNSLAWNGKGVCMSRQKLHYEAEILFFKAISIDSKNETAWNSRGFNLIKMHDFENGLKCFDKSLEINNQFVKAYFNKSSCLISMSKWKESLICSRYGYHYARRKKIIPVREEERCFSMLYNYKDFLYWEVQAKDVVEMCREFDRVWAWGRGLVESIPKLFEFLIINDVADAWLSAWQKAGAGYEELEIPLRMLAAAVEWKKTRSRAALLRLEPELRSKLESLLPPEASVVEAPRKKR